MTNMNILAELNSITDNGLIVPCHVPERTNVVSIIKYLQVTLMPGFFHFNDLGQEAAFMQAQILLKQEIGAALQFTGICDDCASEKVNAFVQKLPEIKTLILSDMQAIYDGDPAAKTKAEVLLCYPGFYAISIYRFAHALYTINIPLLPRIMTEYAHEKTGIDINPGATIGDHFCIDHGTGIVIGETAVLGHHVKLYQGVTIGARSFDLDENGFPVKSGKRHPNIGNHVVIYANATILGGDTYIPDNKVIGGNSWIIHSPENKQ